VCLALDDVDVLQSERVDALTQALQIVRRHIFGDDPAARTDDRRQPHDVIAAARADIGESHAGFDAKAGNELLRLTGMVAFAFAVPDRADDVRDRSIRLRKRICRCAHCRRGVLRGGGQRERGGEDDAERHL